MIISSKPIDREIWLSSKKKQKINYGWKISSRGYPPNWPLTSGHFENNDWLLNALIMSWFNGSNKMIGLVSEQSRGISGSK